jgi:uncharacterized membrane protein (DUF373 family)
LAHSPGPNGLDRSRANTTCRKLSGALEVLNKLLLAFIFVELLDTLLIAVTMSERGIFIAEPFLLVGLIAVIRSILLLVADLKEVQGEEEALNLLFQLGSLTFLVIVLTTALYFTRRIRLSEEKERAIPE